MVSSAFFIVQPTLILKKKKKNTLVIGRQPIIEAIQAGKSIDKIFIAKGAEGEVIGKIRTLARAAKIPVSTVPEGKLNRIYPARRSGKNDQGCLAFLSKVVYLDLQAVISHVIEKGETPLFLLIDGITDVRNIGAMARSALCCGAQALILPEKGVAPLNEEAVKSSAGALEHLMVCRVSHLKQAIKTLHLNGFQILASTLESDSYLADKDWTLPTAVLLGAEDKGVSNALLREADQGFKIPMASDFDSFNVSVATGIILYEAMKQRKTFR